MHTSHSTIATNYYVDPWFLPNKIRTKKKKKIIGVECANRT